MKAILDTHAFLWWISDDPALSSSAREIIADADHEIYLSAVSVWEISIKARAGKLTVFSGDLEKFMDGHIRKNAFSPLPVTLVHAARIHALPNHHRDPFDQMLVAQSQVEGFPIITADKMMHAYDVDIIW